jgi:hypothetical protein
MRPQSRLTMKMSSQQVLMTMIWPQVLKVIPQSRQFVTIRQQTLLMKRCARRLPF